MIAGGSDKTGSVAPNKNTPVKVFGKVIAEANGDDEVVVTIPVDQVITSVPVGADLTNLAGLLQGFTGVINTSPSKVVEAGKTLKLININLMLRFQTFKKKKGKLFWLFTFFYNFSKMIETTT